MYTDYIAQGFSDSCLQCLCVDPLVQREKEGKINCPFSLLLSSYVVFLSSHILFTETTIPLPGLNHAICGVATTRGDGWKLNSSFMK